MIRFYGSFRQEAGSLIVGLGAAGIILGTAELLSDMFGPWISTGQAWLLIGFGLIAGLVGFWMNITRSRRRVDIEVPPRDATMDQPPQQTG